MPLTARPTSTIPERSAIVSASVDGTLGVAIHASPARAALNANSADIRPVAVTQELEQAKERKATTEAELTEKARSIARATTSGSRISP